MSEPAGRRRDAVEDFAPANPAATVEAARPQIIVAEHHLDPATVQIIKEACERAGAAYHAWKTTDRLEWLAGRAALAIGTIAPGSRKIPNDLASLATDRIPGLLLLLIAQEALVRPIVTLHDGLVTLIEPAPSSAHLAHCLRVLLAESPPATPRQGAWWPAIPPEPHGPSPLRRREYRIGASFVGVLEGPRALASAEPVPLTWLRTGAGVSAVVTPSRDEPAAETDGLGDAAAFVTLEVSEARLDWSFRVPHAGAALALFSALRLPPFTDLSLLRTQGEGGSRRLAAAPGDLALAITPFDALGPIAMLGVEPSEGGTGLLDRLEAKLRRASVPCSCLAIEVR